MCCMEIPAAARKCPHCQHLQHTLAFITIHPALGVGVVIGIVAAFLTFFFSEVEPEIREGEKFRDHAGQVTVLESAIRFGEREGQPTVSVTGRVKNDSDVNWEDVYFAVVFYDKDGNLLDAGQEYEYTYHLPAHEEAGFNVSFSRIFPEESYASHVARVVSAEDADAGL
ncbi:MAG: hypothetical protein JXR94_24575, partial [Candidatus Hydrogenedentes bacterium]|nr:hypothetical protein [Candidatus Hydrogenedentota bacterium]